MTDPLARALAYLEAHPTLGLLIATVLAVSVARLPPVDDIKNPWARWVYAQARVALGFLSATATNHFGAKGGFKLPFTFEVDPPAEGTPASTPRAPFLGLFVLAVALGGCGTLPAAKTFASDAVLAVRVANNGLGAALEAVADSAESRFRDEAFAAVERCDPQDAPCRIGAAEKVKNRFRDLQRTYDRAREVQHVVAGALDAADAACLGDPKSETCAALRDAAAAQAPAVARVLKEVTSWR